MPICALLSLALFLMGFVYGPLGACLPSLFPPRVRYTGVSVAFNVGGILGGGLAPMIAASLAERGGLAPVGLYLSGAALLSLVALIPAGPPRQPRVRLKAGAPRPTSMDFPPLPSPCGSVARAAGQHLFAFPPQACNRPTMAAFDTTEDKLITLAPDQEVDAREQFGVDFDMKVPAFTERDSHVPDIDEAYKFDPADHAGDPAPASPTTAA